MNYHHKSKDELINELQKLQQEYNSLKKTCLKENTNHLGVENEIQLQTEIMKNISEGINLIRLEDETIVFTNQKFDKMFGYKRGELIGKHISAINAPAEKSPEEIKQDILEVLKRAGEWHGEIMNIKKNGGHFWCYAHVSLFDHPFLGKVYLSVHSDITEWKQAEKKIRAASFYARNLIEASLDPLVTINAEGKITDVNKATEQITGIKRDELIGSDFAEYFTNPGKARKGYRIVFSKEVVKDYPLTIRHKSGKTKDVLYNATLYKNESGEIQGVFAAARDITDQKKLDLKLKKSKEMLEKLNQHLNEIRENERTQIALNLHDDLGQKLTALNLDIAWIKSRTEKQPEAIGEKLKEMSQLINDTIESIREISSFLRPSILYELGLKSAVEWQLTLFEKQSGISFYFKCNQEEFKIDDKISLILYRILQESLTNIIRHSEASIAEVDLRVIKKNIEMTIRDNGKGMESEKIHSNSSMGIAGIIERIRSVNGRVQIGSKTGTGTIIKISVPLTKKQSYDKSANNR